MIFNHHLLLNSLLNRTISLDYREKEYLVNYYEADLLELNKNLSQANTKYPLIWLETGYKEEHRVNGSELLLTNCTFVFITKGDQNDIYKKRFETSFNDILYPLVALFEKKIRKMQGISFNKDYHEIISLPFNDVSELSARSRMIKGVTKRMPESQPLTDIWDALILDTNLSISTNCFPEFIIKK